RFSRDWSSDVCSSDLPGDQRDGIAQAFKCTPHRLGVGRLEEAKSPPRIGRKSMNQPRALMKLEAPAVGTFHLQYVRPADGFLVRSEERRVGKGWSVPW